MDTGCSRTIVAPKLSKIIRGECHVVAVDGSRVRCLGECVIPMVVAGVSLSVNCIAGAKLITGVDMILGMDVINRLGGVFVHDNRVSFGCEQSRGTGGGKDVGQVQPQDVLHTTCLAPCYLSSDSHTVTDHTDFKVEHDSLHRTWTATWKWIGDAEPDALSNNVAEYSMPEHVRPKFEKEIEKWIENGWLRKYDSSDLGPPKALIPLMAVVQQNKDKVRPVMDFRELNSFVEAHTADADVCADKIREWRRQGHNVSTLDLSSAYMQVHVAKPLWPFQTVIFRGTRYCLTRLGFGLNVAPLVMKTVIAAALSLDESVRKAASPYVDDIFVNEDLMAASDVHKHLEKCGLICKPAERVADGARVLGLWVRGDGGVNQEFLQWSRANELPSSPEVTTRRSVFSFCGKLVGHLPVCGWLRPAVSFLKRRVNALSRSWDERFDDRAVNAMIADILNRVRENDPARGRWEVNSKEATVWVDASSLAFGASVEVGGHIIEDASWLRPENSSHINIAELDALIKGVNLALCWGLEELHLKTDSLTVYHWISDALSRKARLKTKAVSEMLIRRRIGIFQDIVNEYKLKVDIALVPSSANLADVLTRVPQNWLKGFDDPHTPVSCAASCALTLDFLADLHGRTGHQGVQRTLYFARKIDSSVSKSDVARVVQTCNTCSSIDPAPVHWKRGHLGVNETWSRVAMDFTHYRGMHYLTLIDCGPTRFSIWRQVRAQDSSTVVGVLEQIFYERGPPIEILTDNDTAFRSDIFRQFLCRWGVRLRFRCAYVPSGNGIAERAHRTIKRIAARSDCSVAKAVYLYNVTPKDNSDPKTAPANQLYCYEVRVLGVDAEVAVDRCVQSPYVVGDAVFVKPSGARCDMRYSKGVVTRVVSEHAVEVDGMLRHVRDLRSVSVSGDGDAARVVNDDSVQRRRGTAFEESSDEEEAPEPVLRRSTRTVRPPDRLGVECWSTG